LQLGWRLETSGPSPDSDGWVATLTLDARGGDEIYIYWAAGDIVNALESGLIPDNRILVRKEKCSPAQIQLAVTSAGQTTVRDMMLQVDSCLEPDFESPP
jgi:hypothetical protein